MVSTIMLCVGAAFETRCAVRKNWYAAFAGFEFDAFEFVHVASGEVPRKIRLILTQDVDTEMLGLPKGFDIAR